jgi:DNA-nicking Smr family endonuclease
LGRKAPPPDDDDARIWEKLTETVRPLAGRQSRATRVTKPVVQGNRDTEQKKSEQVNPLSAPPRSAQNLAPSPLDPNETRKVRRGYSAIEARLDLHGLTATAAHRRLLQFIENAQAQRLTWIIVITGKGVGGKGVLRQSVPDWLSTAPLKSKIVGFEAAQPAHGGSGALYVRLRRKS